MNTATALKNLAAALRHEYAATVDAANRALRDQPAKARDLEDRAASLKAEHGRRAAAGVSPNLAHDSFDGRHMALLQEKAQWEAVSAKARTDMANALTSTLLRALQACDAAAQALNIAEAERQRGAL